MPILSGITPNFTTLWIAAGGNLAFICSSAIIVWYESGGRSFSFGSMTVYGRNSGEPK